jgi:seryl-tRNA synthetase
MKRTFVLSSLCFAVLAAACGRNQVAVEAAILDEQAEPIPLAGLEVRLIPYDRDAIFDSLEAQFPEPEPAIPPEVLAQREQIIAAEREWRTAEERWTEARDSLRHLSQELERMGAQGLRATPQYQQMFRQFERLENDARQAQQRSQTAFARYDELQREYLSRADSIRIVRESWEDQAYRDYPRIATERQRQMRREEHVDTTDAAGVTRFRGVPQGRWWVMSRYRLPFEELYWNLPVEVSGDSVGISLNRDNAEVRPVM